MNHRKTAHDMSECRRHIENNCRFTASSCWYNHGGNNKTPTADMKSPGKPNESQQSSSAQSGFWETPANLAPPSTPTITQAAWIKMMKMMNEMKNLMSMIKESNKFLS